MYRTIYPAATITGTSLVTTTIAAVTETVYSSAIIPELRQAGFVVTPTPTASWSKWDQGNHLKGRDFERIIARQMPTATGIDYPSLVYSVCSCGKKLGALTTMTDSVICTSMVVCLTHFPS